MSEQSAGALVVPSTEPRPIATAMFASVAGFEVAHQIATQLASSQFVPDDYKGTKGIGNLLIAMELANRTQQPLMAVLQSLHVIHGKPGWAAQWIIMQINQSPKFVDGLRFEWENSDPEKDGLRHKQTGALLAPGDTCYGYAVRRSDGSKAVGTRISIAMAEKEGWMKRTGSKWLTMPEQMLMYRAATFFARAHCPEVLFGAMTQDELVDIGAPEPEQRGSAARLNERADGLDVTLYAHVAKHQ